MCSIRSLITLILVSLLVFNGCGGGGDSKDKGTKVKEPEKKVTKPVEPKGPGGVELE